MSKSRNIPTVILVHGGFADASFWAPVIKDLQAHNVPVLSPPNPLRGLAHDVRHLAACSALVGCAATGELPVRTAADH